MRALCVLLLFTFPAFAAEPLPSFADVVRFRPAGLLTESGIQEELKLTVEQVNTIGKAARAGEKAFADGWKGLGEKPLPEAVAKLVADTRVAADMAFAAELTAGQVKRLGQLHLQSRGPAAFDDPVVQKAVGNVTDEQRKKWADAKDDFDRKLGRLRRENGGMTTVKTIPGTDIPQAGQVPLTGKTVTALKKEYALASKLVLTSEQLDKWYDLLGDIYPNPEKKPK